MSDSFLELRNLKKSFTSDEYVLQGISLTIGKGEFITLLGASGCGKTTTLRIIAGLEQPDSGSVWLEGQDVTALEPNKRDVNTVFQNYALFPHMNVAENIGCWSLCSWKDTRNESLPSFQVDKGSEWQLQGHWPTIHGYCFLMSHLEHLICSFEGQCSWN